MNRRKEQPINDVTAIKRLGLTDQEFDAIARMAGYVKKADLKILVTKDKTFDLVDKPK